MLDLLYLACILGLFMAAWGLVALCEHLRAREG